MLIGKYDVKNGSNTQKRIGVSRCLLLLRRERKDKTFFYSGAEREDKYRGYDEAPSEQEPNRWVTLRDDRNQVCLMVPVGGPEWKRNYS